MRESDAGLLAHLMRRAGFGATRCELEELATKGYAAVVEDLVNPERSPEVEDDVLERYYTGLNASEPIDVYAAGWIYWMVNTRRPLQEKMVLFWHHVFATGWHKNENVPAAVGQIATFRRNCLGHFRDILLDLSRDPAMIDWLDNQENHKGAINENYGRELLELFSMGVGNYTETDIKEAARAFTGWSFEQPIPLYPCGYFPAYFRYREDDHDDGEKIFLGHSGRLNGQDIIDIVVEQPATARFISRHLYNFFVADEPQVPAWQTVPPQDPDAIDTLVNAFAESDGDIRAVMRVLFNSDFFKDARYKKVKSPAEFVVGATRMSGAHQFPEPGLGDLVVAASAMGQYLYNPPTVEGWHTGKEWIDGGTLNERVNFAVDLVGDTSQPGIREIIGSVCNGSSNSGALTPAEFVDKCLDAAGALELNAETRAALIRHAEADGGFHPNGDNGQVEARVIRMLQLIVSSTEYQFA